jgi:hypothetical protein
MRKCREFYTWGPLGVVRSTLGMALVVLLMGGVGVGVVHGYNSVGGLVCLLMMCVVCCVLCGMCVRHGATLK